jgi:hypothetical protein
MTGIPLPWQILIAAGVITGIAVVLAAFSRADRRGGTRRQRR